MDVARLNFSHGDHSDHEENYKRVRAASDATGKAVGVLADLQGPKIRLGRFAEDRTTWADGEVVRITVDDVEGTHDRVSTTYKQLAEDARPGDRLLVDDGKVGLVVTGVEGNDVVCRVTEGGPVSNNKGVSLPGMNVSVPALSEKDIADLEFALGLGVDFIALSFVRSPADVELVHAVMDRVGRRIPVIAKLEKPEAIDNLEAIVLAFDAVMVARGDLGVELPLEQVPLVQKRAIQIARENAKPVIVATQMLESMIENSRPTRAEASDVANAIFDGSDAVMLSAETASGHYPVDAVQMMARIVMAAEQHPKLGIRAERAPFHKFSETDEFTDALAGSARYAAEQLDAKFIVVFTQTGFAARLMSKFRPAQPIIAITPSNWVARRMNILWGVQPFVLRDVGEYHEQIVERVDEYLLSRDIVVPGDRLVIMMGSPIYQRAKTNLLRVHRVVAHV